MAYEYDPNDPNSPLPGAGDEGSAQAVAATQAQPAPSPYQDMSPQDVANARAAINGSLANGTMSREVATKALSALPQTPQANLPPVQAATQPQTPQKPVNLTPPPAAPAAPGNPGQAQGGINPLQLMAVSAPAHAAGYSPSDKAFTSSLRQSATDLHDALTEHTNQQSDILKAFQDQADNLSVDSLLAKHQYETGMQADQTARRQLAQETKDKHSQVLSRLADLESQGVDPNRYWHNLGTGGTIGQAIAMGLGTFGSGLAHVQNTAVDQVNQAIGRDIDAQKTNLQKNLESLKTRIDLNNTSFDQNSAMLKAERDSVLTGYTIAQNDIAKRAAMYKDNADVQMNANNMTAKLRQDMTSKLDDIHEKLWQVGKRGETMVGGANNDKAMSWVRDKSAEIVKDSQGKVSPQQATKMAFDLYTGAQTSGTVEPWAKGASNKPSPKAQDDLNQIDTALSQVNGLIAKRQSHHGGTLSPEDTAAAKADSIALRAQIGHAMGGRMTESELKALSGMIPEDPLQFSASGMWGADPTMAQMNAVRSFLQQKRQVISANPQTGNETPNGNPDDLAAEK